MWIDCSSTSRKRKCVCRFECVYVCFGWLGLVSVGWLLGVGWCWVPLGAAWCRLVLLGAPWCSLVLLGIAWCVLVLFVFCLFFACFLLVFLLVFLLGFCWVSGGVFWAFSVCLASV